MENMEKSKDCVLTGKAETISGFEVTRVPQREVLGLKMQLSG
jgi:hypothetical protein